VYRSRALKVTGWATAIPEAGGWFCNPSSRDLWGPVRSIILLKRIAARLKIILRKKGEKMRINLLASGAIALVTCALLVQAGDEKKMSAENSGLELFKGLAGEWTGKGNHDGREHDARIVYKVTSGGSAVVETIDPGGEHEMITVIHPDGDGLGLTHYCMLGNQPQMRAKPKSGENKVAFEFVKASNLKSENDMHMHSVTYTFVDKDTLKAEWTNYVDGKESGKAVFELIRKK
jgi:hypothetical protein